MENINEEEMITVENEKEVYRYIIWQLLSVYSSLSSNEDEEKEYEMLVNNNYLDIKQLRTLFALRYRREEKLSLLSRLVPYFLVLSNELINKNLL